MMKPASDLEPSDGRRRHRDTAIRRTVVASGAARIVSLACSLVQVPLGLLLLGSEAYGLWVTLTSLAALLGFFDLGLGIGMQNQVADAIGRDEPIRPAAIFATTFAWLTGIGLAVFLVVAPLIAAVPLDRWLSLENPNLQGLAKPGGIASLALFCAGLPLSTGVRLAYGLQLGWLAAAWGAIGAVLQVGAILVAIQWQVSFPTFVLLAGGGVLMGHTALLLHLLKRLQWSRANLDWADPADRRRLLRSSLLFCLPQAGATFLYSAAAPVISVVAGQHAVAAYHALQRLFGILPQLQQLVLAPLWPAYTNAATRGDFSWIRLNYRRSLHWTLFACGPLLGVGVWIVPELLPIWTAPAEISAPFSLVIAVATWDFLLCLGQPPAILLGGLGRVRRLAWFSLAGNLASAAAMLWLGSKWGAPGVVFGLAAGFATIGLPFSLLEAQRTLHDAEYPRL